jgi:hypothetical protein
MTCDTEQSFLEDLVFFVPEGKACADVLMGVAESANAVFTLYLSVWSKMREIPSGRL